MRIHRLTSAQTKSLSQGNRHFQFGRHDIAVLSKRRSAFTLIELLVVIAIILILAAVTLATVNFSVNADRVRAGARQIQSYLMGARDKAIYANEIRGVRFLLDPNDNHSVSAMQYIGAPPRETGSLTFSYTITGDSTGRTVAQQTQTFGNSTAWSSLYRRGLLQPGCRIQIPQDTGPWFTIGAYYPNSGTPLLSLDRPYPELAGSGSQITYALQLAATPLGDSQPVQLPRGVVVDLDGSYVPNSWRAGGISTTYLPTMDILFTPRGTVTGNSNSMDLSSLGMVHLLLADASDVVKWKSTTLGLSGRNGTSYLPGSLPIVPAENPSNSPPLLFKDRVLVSLTTRTGNVAAYPLNVNNVSGNQLTDPFYFAETGQVANK